MRPLASATLALFATLFSLQGVGASQETLSTERSWDLSVWISAATGEEITNSFAEAQTLSAGVFLGKSVTGEVGRGWWQGQFEYGVSVNPLFFELRPQLLHGIAFEPVILRWNSVRRFGRAAPYVELAGGGVRTNLDLPRGNTSNFNFTVNGGGGIYLLGRDQHAFDVGVLWTHISNANLGVQNPELNGIALRVGYHWFR
jgi:Lipid A 3-O-deacylase (PagL)